MNVLELTAAQLRQAADIKEKIEALQAELAAILGGGATDAPAAVAVPGKKLHWTQTPEGKARMDKIRRARWDKRRY
jgi:hypothetical protein